LTFSRIGPSGTSPEGRSALDVLLHGVFEPARFLELIRDFVFFETDGARTWKVLAKYHQVDAVNAAVESVARAMGADKRGGIVWHSQGAGKSYSMVFFANKLRRDRRFGNPTIVAVTDRTELDELLRSYGAKHIVITGCTTSICVESTIRDAFFRDYHCILLEDCAAEPMGRNLSRSNHEATVLLVERIFGSVSNSNDFINAVQPAGALTA